MPDRQQPAPGYTKSSLVLIAALSAFTLVFAVAGITGFEPALKVFRWLALVL